MKRKLLALALAAVTVFGMAVPAMAADAPQPTYTDVYSTDWFVDDVRYVYVGDLMDGVGAGDMFGPKETTIRAEIVDVLYRLEGKPQYTRDTTFTDVQDESKYDEAIYWAAANDIVNGYGNGKFGPSDKITREQMATILYRYVNWKGIDTSKKSTLAQFKDKDTISSWAVDAFAWANAAGLINGTSSTTISPKGDAARAQTAAVVHRFGEKVVGVYYPDDGSFVAAVKEGANTTTPDPATPNAPTIPAALAGKSAAEMLQVQMQYSVEQNRTMYAEWEAITWQLAQETYATIVAEMKQKGFSASGMWDFYHSKYETKQQLYDMVLMYHPPEAGFKITFTKGQTTVRACFAVSAWVDGGQYSNGAESTLWKSGNAEMSCAFTGLLNPDLSVLVSYNNSGLPTFYKVIDNYN